MNFDKIKKETPFKVFPFEVSSGFEPLYDPTRRKSSAYAPRRTRGKCISTKIKKETPFKVFPFEVSSGFEPLYDPPRRKSPAYAPRRARGKCISTK